MSQNQQSHYTDTMQDETQHTFHLLVKYFSEKITLTEQEITLLQEKSQFLSVRKGEMLLREGMVSNHTYFVAKGLLRVFTRNENAEEYTITFGSENWWVNDTESYDSGMQSHCYIEALEDSALIAFRKNDFDAVLELSTNIQKLTLDLIQRNLVSNKGRILHQIKDTPQQRYQHFLDNYAHIANRVPLYMIASYLGISRKTLTRIRGGK